MTDRRTSDMNPDAAAFWMAQRVKEAGRLRQIDAVGHLMQFRDPNLAYYNDEEQACVGRAVLRRFRRRYPDLRYDRRLKSWRRS